MRQCFVQRMNGTTMFLFGLVCLYAATLGCCTQDYHQLFDQVLQTSSYDKRTRPGSLTGERTTVTITMHINDISSVDELDMELSLDIYLRQSWLDQRLKTSLYNDTINLNYNMVEKLWLPDLYFANSKRGNFHNVAVPNMLLRVSPDGEILFSQRLTITLTCVLQLKKYPMDNQTCKVYMESYSHTEDQLVFIWAGEGVNAIQKDHDISLPEFTLGPISSGVCQMPYITGSYTCIYAEITLQRTIGYYLIQTYIPCMLVVILSWVSFWIDMHAVPARITLGLLTVLTMATQASAVTQTLPRVSYIKAIDVWIAICLLFVFCALLEYSVVNVLARRVQGKLLHRMSTNNKLDKSRQPISRSSLAWLTRGEMSTSILRAAISTHSLPQETSFQNGVSVASSKNILPEDSEDQEAPSIESKQKRKNLCFAQLWHKDKALYVDKASRILFPSAFVLFNFVYWTTYVYIVI